MITHILGTDSNLLKPYFIMTKVEFEKYCGHWQQISPNFTYRKNAINWAKRNGYFLPLEVH